MNLKELTFPLRVYWDLATDGGEPTLDVTEICGGIAEIKPLGLSLLDTGDQVSDGCIRILEELKNKNISITLTVPLSVINVPALKLLSDLDVDELLIDASAENDYLPLAEFIRSHESGKMKWGLSFSVGKNNFRGIADIVSFCLNSNISRLVFPMGRIKTASDCFFIPAEERRSLTAKLRGAEPDNLNITIHDPFLWRIFYPDVAFPGAGCQAANTMAYISPDGGVYPCPSMPLMLGNLRETTLRMIFCSTLKREVRRKLLEPPEECSGCDQLKQCVGGCRGRAFAAAGSLDRRDPACE